MKTNREWVGRKINRWTIVNCVNTKKGVAWICRCDCGEEKQQKVWNVKSGKSRMCAKCSARERERRKRDGYKIDKQER